MEEEVRKGVVGKGGGGMSWPEAVVLVAMMAAVAAMVWRS